MGLHNINTHSSSDLPPEAEAPSLHGALLYRYYVDLCGTNSGVSAPTAQFS